MSDRTRRRIEALEARRGSEVPVALAEARLTLGPKLTLLRDALDTGAPLPEGAAHGLTPEGVAIVRRLDALARG
ncbi:hypothetical protein KJ059_00550 [Myxococcota bacterium]|nr:hypothetical protein [Myxococcota bacterium]